MTLALIDFSAFDPFVLVAAVIVALVIIVAWYSLRAQPAQRREERLPSEARPPVADAPSPSDIEAEAPPVEYRAERLERMESRPRASSAPAQAPASAPPGEEREDHYAVTVFFATDREDSHSDDPKRRFSSARARPPRGETPVSYGSCVVTIPKSHKVGELEAPSWYDWRGEQASRHVILQSLRTTDRNGLLFDLDRAMRDDKQAFVFVHGFSVAFEDAARRTAQMAFDMKFPGVPIFFSWPTEVQGLLNPLAYSEAENNARWATEHFRAFLADIVRETGAETVHLIAHSMGNRIVTDALMQVFWMLTPEEKKIIGEVILTAPDIDAEVFVDQIAPRITSMNTRLTLYTASDDGALITSKTLRGYPRAGDFGGLAFLPAKVDVVDASDTGTDSLGHNYYGDAQSVMSDICHLMVSRQPAERRALTLAGLMSARKEPYWRVRKEITLAQVWSVLGGGPGTPPSSS